MAYSTRLLLIMILGLGACATQPDAQQCTTGIVCPVGTQCAAVQQVCITNDCGDGLTQATLGEKCDDGNIIDGDGCAANCLSQEVCGDGVLNSAAGELCDDGNTTGGDGCGPDCRSVEVCGNGIRDLNEACDDGNTLPGDGCSGNCKSTEVCGNGIVDINEKCDDGSTPGGCNDDCQGGTGCGDGAIDRDGAGNPLEECDDGNTDNQDDCLNSCNLNTCGDGVIQTSGARTEQCDPSLNFGETSACNVDCTTRSCGDGKINNAAGEECDDALTNADDRDCTSTCHVNVCGDGLRNEFGATNPEACDDGNANQLDGCSNECTTPACGNGVVEMLEACDDFNTTSGDGCSSGCQFESCHDGVVNNGEDCDPGMGVIETAACNSDCTFSSCGDLRVNAADGEQCDDGNTMDNDTCRPPAAGPTKECKLNVCGDGNKSPTEGCDDGNTNNTDACSNACTSPTCGDGVQNGVEECDDGNTSDTDSCLTTTCLRATCGDGKVWSSFEQCDNGTTTGNGPDKNCTATCRINVCGDGFRDQEGGQTEACDDGNTSNETACPYGVLTCTLCNSNCTATEALSGNVCGDGVPVSPETCDDGNLASESVCPYGAATCMFCNNRCTSTISLSNGSYCGDGTTDAANGEACDDKSSTQSCGRCDNACNNFTAAAKATGFVLMAAGAQLQDNDTLTVVDGYGLTVTFEFDKSNNGVGMGNVAITTGAGDSAATMQGRLKSAINSAFAKIAATDGGSNGIVLTHAMRSSLGNQPIVNNVSTNDFFASGMSGGAAGNCAAMVPCTNNDDCASNDCNGGFCTAP